MGRNGIRLTAQDWDPRLGITDVVAYNVLSGYVAYPGMALGLLTVGVRRNAAKKRKDPETKGRRIALYVAGLLGMLGFLLLWAVPGTATP